MHVRTATNQLSLSKRQRDKIEQLFRAQCKRNDSSFSTIQEPSKPELNPDEQNTFQPIKMERTFEHKATESSNSSLSATSLAMVSARSCLDVNNVPVSQQNSSGQQPSSSAPLASRLNTKSNKLSRTDVRQLATSIVGTIRKEKQTPVDGVQPRHFDMSHLPPPPPFYRKCTDDSSFDVKLNVHVSKKTKKCNE